MNMVEILNLINNWMLPIILIGCAIAIILFIIYKKLYFDKRMAVKDYLKPYYEKYLKYEFNIKEFLSYISSLKDNEKTFYKQNILLSKSIISHYLNFVGFVINIIVVYLTIFTLFLTAFITKNSIIESNYNRTISAYEQYINNPLVKEYSKGLTATISEIQRVFIEINSNLELLINEMRKSYNMANFAFSNILLIIIIICLVLFIIMLCIGVKHYWLVSRLDSFYEYTISLIDDILNKKK